MYDLREAAEKIGFSATGIKVPLDELMAGNLFPCIAHWQQKHFIVIYKTAKEKIYVSDPAHGRLVYNKEDFLKGWSSGNHEGFLLVVEPTDRLDETKQKVTSKKKGIRIITRYLVRYKKWMLQAFIALFAGSLLQLIFPFLTQRIVDRGIKNNDLHFIYLILMAQLFLFLGRTVAEVIRSYILLKLSSHINISLVSDFFKKLMSLPLGFFDVKKIGDIIQRITDHQRIENFLSSGALNVSFSVFNILIFSGVLAWYDLRIFSVFLIGGGLYFTWFWYFMKKRAELDYKRFSQLSENHEKNLELIYGMQEIKLHNAEEKKRIQWEQLQFELFKTNQKSFALRQKQTVGSSLINELKNILITVLSAGLVIKGTLSLGEMLAISYITGQLNQPVSQLIDFLQSYQDAILSAERINEIHNKPGENETGYELKDGEAIQDIEIRNLYFSYHHNNRQYVLKNISFTIPKNKVTAIVGASGSGKTTLMKLLLKFYEPSGGEIFFGKTGLKNIKPQWWRNYCGAVLQEGYLFSDTIENNIALNDLEINEAAIQSVLKSANIHEFVNSLPSGIYTKIGQGGPGLSTGQKQRILIARALYKNPLFLLFDEATSSLDAGNEKTIMENLGQIFNTKTVLIIAHRLSTVKNADNIIVLDNGEVKEAGTHNELVKKKGLYFELIRNQLELGE
jgi:ATP-binding cassette subfamily B protein